MIYRIHFQSIEQIFYQKKKIFYQSIGQIFFRPIVLNFYWSTEQIFYRYKNNKKGHPKENFLRQTVCFIFPIWQSLQEICLLYFLPPIQFKKWKYVMKKLTFIIIEEQKSMINFTQFKAKDTTKRQWNKSWKLWSWFEGCKS